jgi:type VI secretion system ImpJ/VasE family protein
VTASYYRLNRTFSLPFPYGLYDFELDLEALSGSRITVRRFSAIMPDGLEISEPGNCILKPLDLTETLKKFPAEITVYIATPNWSELEANLAVDSEAEKKLYLPKETRVRDENNGGNEISLITRKINARLLTDLDDSKDMQLLPVLKLQAVSYDTAEAKLSIDANYIPPFVLLTSDCPLMDEALGLLFDLRRTRDKLFHTLSTIKFQAENFSGIDAYNVFQLKVLNLYESRLSTLLVSGAISPFDLYVELTSLRAELSALHPANELREIKRYQHDDYALAFREIIGDIRALISAEGGANYIKRDFISIEDGNFLYAELRTEDIVRASEVYLAIHADMEDWDIIKALELGDNFKLMSPRGKQVRARGVKLTEMRYPPRFLPVLPRTLWFKLQLEESAKVWQEMCEDKGIVIDWAHNLFPGLETALFITVVEQRKNR